MDDDAILTQPISTNEMVFIYSSSGKLSAYTFQDNENKYLTKKLDATQIGMQSIDNESSSDGENLPNEEKEEEQIIDSQ